MTETLLIFAALLVILFTGLPVFITLGVMGVGYLLLSGQNLASMATVVFGSLDHFVLVALPLFILMAQIMTRAGVGQDLFRFVHAWLRHLPGGLAITTVVTCAIFSSVCGSSTATAVTVGIAAIPPMLKYGYQRKFVLGLVAAGGTLGILIPPSGPLIIYGAITDTSVGKLFMAGVLPGIMICLIYMAYCLYRALRENIGKAEEPASWEERWQSLKRASFSLLMPLIIIGGIYTGAFTPTEAAGIGAGLSFLLCFGILRRLGLKDVVPIMQETVKTTSMLFMIMATAIFFGQVLTVNQVPQRLVQWVVEIGMSKWAFLIFVNILLIFLGDFLEVVSIMLITIPIFFPVLLKLGIDPVWFGIIFIINMELALITPPVGLNLYVILGIVRTTMGEVLKGAYPFMILLSLALILVMIFPGLALWLPAMVK